MALKEKKTRKALLAKLRAAKEKEKMKEELLKNFLEEYLEMDDEWLKEEREENGPFEMVGGKEIIAWMPDDFDDDGNLREGMKKWQYLLDGTEPPEEEE